MPGAYSTSAALPPDTIVLRGPHRLRDDRRAAPGLATGQKSVLAAAKLRQQVGRFGVSPGMPGLTALMPDAPFPPCRDALRGCKLPQLCGCPVRLVAFR